MGFTRLETNIPDLILIEPDVFKDKRGFFKESYNKNAFEQLGLDLDFVQDNMSFSTKGILRGMHFQAPPFAQGKLVSVLKGKAQDVAIDIRKGSPTYGKAFSVELSADNHRMLYVPPGFAHGFLVLSDECLFYYKCTNFYNKESEGGLMWNDPQININWGMSDPIISEKDAMNALFAEFESPFEFEILNQ